MLCWKSFARYKKFPVFLISKLYSKQLCLRITSRFIGLSTKKYYTFSIIFLGVSINQLSQFEMFSNISGNIPIQNKKITGHL